VLEGGVLEVVCIDASYDPPATVEQSLSRN